METTNPPTQESNEQSGGIRKLAAIMFTDIVGFSKKMGSNEFTTLDLLETHNKLISEVVAKHKGNIIKSIGDAFFVEFQSTVNAVQSAIECQKVLFEHNQSAPPDKQIQIRIGVHVGDVVFKGGDIFGDGVNIAARIQPLAEPGGICISEDVARQIRGKVELPLIKLGTSELKNITIPVVIYHIVLPWEDKQKTGVKQIQFQLKHRRRRVMMMAGATAVLAAVLIYFTIFNSSVSLAEGDRSIAVLPLTNVSGQENEYLSDGFTQNLIRDLSQTPGLLTISETSSFLFKNSTLPDSSIGSELGIRFILKGNFQTTATNINLRLSLVDTKDNSIAWKEFYDFPRSEFLAKKEVIVSSIVECFGLELPPVKKTSYTVSTTAYELYLKGLYHSNNSGKNANSLAIEYFSEAIQADAKFSDCLVSLAHTQAFRYEQNWETSDKLIVDAESNCLKAIDIDPENSTAIAVLAFIKLLNGNQQSAIDLFNKVLEKDPSNGVALDNLGKLNLRELNNPAKGVTLYKKLVEIRPTDWLLNSNLGIGYAQLKNYSEAFKSFKKAISLNPKEPFAWNNLGYAYERIVNLDSAVECYSKALSLDPTNPLFYESLVTSLLSLRKFSTAESILTKGTSYLQGSHEIHYLLGLALLFNGKELKARLAFQDGLSLLDRKIKKNSTIGIMHAQKGLFLARLGQGPAAVASAETAVQFDSLNSEVNLTASRIYAILGKKEKMLILFEKARSMNPEYDAAFITTAIDFEKYRQDPDLLLTARQE